MKLIKHNYLLFLLLITVYGLLFTNFSRGDVYYNRLSQWYKYAQTGDWDKASSLEPQLDPIDLAVFKKKHHPLELKKYVNSLVVKDDKTVDDWMELARIQSILGKTEESLEALAKAHQLDPIRDDISRLYYRSTK